MECQFFDLCEELAFFVKKLCKASTHIYLPKV